MTELRTFARQKAEIRRESRSVYRSLHRRAASKAASLSRLAKAKMRAELCNEALSALIALAYETYADGTPANVDPKTGDLWIIVPWSSKNYATYGLKRTEADILRAYMLRLGKMAIRGGVLPPVFTYDPTSRNWALNRADYPTLEAAMTWLKRYQLTPEVLQIYLQYVRKQRRKVTQKRRKRWTKP